MIKFIKDVKFLKKFLGILVLSLLWCNVSYAELIELKPLAEFKKCITAKKDVIGKEKDPPEKVDIKKLLLQMKKRQITHCVWL